jgi:hypothetical protein
LSRVCRLYDPNVFFAVMLLQLLVMLIKFSKFIRKNVSVRHKIKMLLSKSLLHSNNIETQSIFSSNFMTLRKMVDFLVLI